MRAFAPDVVITHSPVDYMLDHEEAARLVRTAAFAVAMPLYDTLQVSPATRPGGTPALYYADSVEGLDYYGKRIYPDFYVNIADQIENKRQMLARHSSQREWLRSHHGVDEYLDRMTGWARQYGSECGFPLAEGFRQHLGHGYPHDYLIQSALARYVQPRV
jgi:LmbE family N-acetylglucosaminyl deacetylase